MSLRFTKMHGLGNDFVVVDATQERATFTADIVQRISDRRTGIGFDQLLIIEPSLDQEHDFVYRIFNADGQEVEQCGNGARCVAHYLFTGVLSNKKEIRLATLSGTIKLTQERNGEITVNMGPPQFIPEKIPFIVAEEKLQYELLLEGNLIQFGAVSLGNPHIVIMVSDLSTAPVQQIGQQLQAHLSFPKQVNVGFMEIVKQDHIRLRVFERGVGETRACGSGACAAAVIGQVAHRLNDKVKVDLTGGSLSVRWHAPLGDVFLTGPAEKVFKGELI